MSDEVIARFSFVGFAIRTLVSAAIMLVCWITFLRHPTGTSALGYAWATDKNLVFIIFIFTPLFVWVEAAITWQIIFHGGRAVWIEKGRLRYLPYGRANFSSVAVDDVKDLVIKPASFLRFSRIEIRTKGGWSEYITPFFLSGSAHVVRARLAEALGLKPGQTNV